LPTPTHFVSQSATNGFALGVNSGSGNSRAAPWLTLDYAVANAPSGSVIEVNDGIYSSATWLDIATKTMTVFASNRRQVIVRGSSTARVVNFASTSTNRTLLLRGVILDGQGSCDRGVTIGASLSTATLGVTLYDCSIINCDTSMVYSDLQKALNLTIERCDMSGTTSAYGIDIRAHESGDVVIDGLNITGTATSTSIKRLVWMNSVAGGSSFRASRVVGAYTSAAVSGSMQGIYVENVNDAIIENCAIDVRNTNASASAIVVVSTTATYSANNAVIRGNTTYTSGTSGHGVLAGAEGTTAGNNNHNNANIYGNMISGAPAMSVMHGVMLGWGTGGDVHGNTLLDCGLATIAKEQIGGVFHDNIIHRAKSEALRAKGATGSKWENNTVYVSAGNAGDCMNVTENDAPSNTVASAIEFNGNTFFIDATPTGITEVNVGSSAAFTGNTYVIDAALGADPWKYQGTAYQTLAAWKAVEPTALP